MAYQRIARIGDSASGTCTAHSHTRAWTGVFTTATGGFTVDGVQVISQGDTGITDCGHTFRFDAGDSILTGVGGRQIAREGDPVIVVEGGSGVITSGSDTAVSE
jgi:uncharacterized Zn-binding protein involved in type VI secretion